MNTPSTLNLPALESIRYALQTSDNVIRHYGTNATERGLAHPQQLALDNNQEALEALQALDRHMSKASDIGWCPVCRAPRHSLPAPAEGNCSHCYNHLMAIRDPFADMELISQLRTQVENLSANAQS